MNFRYNWLICTIFLIIAVATSLGFAAYVAIALLLICWGTILLPAITKLTINYGRNRQKSSIEQGLVLASLILFCTLVPQVDTNRAIFTNPVESLIASSGNNRYPS
ncbi:MAG: hypothetical protein AAFQ41_04825 [Cyanobacteria bacterium J06623_7]